MSTTIALANMPSTPTDVAVNFIDQSKIQLESLVKEGTATLANYVYADGSLANATLISVRVSIDPKTGLHRHSIRLTTDQTVTVDGVVSEVSPVAVELNWTFKGYARDVDALSAMIGTAYSLAFNGVTTKVPNTDTLEAISRGLIHALFG